MSVPSLMRTRRILILFGLSVFACFGLIPPASGQQQTNSPYPLPVQQTPATKQKSSETPSAATQRRADLVRKRADWFHRQRAYPLQHIPAGALQKAIEQRNKMIQQQRSGLRLASGIVSFPGDAFWHLAGPQPTNIPSLPGLVNVGFPTVSGRVTALAVDPTDATGQTIYLGGAAGGVWKTTNGGTNWTPLTDSQPSLAVGSIAIDPNNHTIIYVGTGEENFNQDAYYGAGILKSTDGGTTWAQLGASLFAGAQTPFGGAKVGAIAVQPGNSNIVLAAVTYVDGGTAGGIYRSADAGATWSQVSGANAPIGAAGTEVIFEPTSIAGTTAIVYAAMGDPFGGAANGVYKSADSGQTWTRLAGGFPASNVGRIKLAYAPSTSGAGATLYAAVADSSVNSANLLGFFVTKAGGTTWTQLVATPNFCSGQCFFDMAVAVHPTNPNFVVVGGSAYTDNSTTLFKTIDGGTTWSTDSATPTTDFTNGSTSTRPHVDTHALAFATNGATPRLYVGDDGGVWRTDDPTPGNPLWVDLNSTLALSQFYPGIQPALSDENYGFGGTQDNDIQVFTGTLDWTNAPACGDGGFTAVDVFVPTTIYAGCNVTAASKVTKSVFNGLFTPGPTPTPVPSFQSAETAITAAGDRMQFIPPLAVDSNNTNTLYFGTCRVWQTRDATANWTQITGDLSATNVSGSTCPAGTDNITTIDVSQNSSDVVLAGTSNGKVWESLNATFGGVSTWTEIDNALLPNRHITAVRLRGNSSTPGAIAYATFSGFGSCVGCDGKGHVFKSTNAASGASATWTDISGNLPDAPVNDIIVYHTGSPAFDALYIATDVGVFSCPDPESATPCKNWTVIGDPMPNAPVIALAMRPQTRILRAATHGRSVWDIQLTDQQLPAQLLLSSLTPAAVLAGSTTTTVTVMGANFSPNTKVLFNGLTTGVSTTVNNTTQITAIFDTSLLTDGGVFTISLADPLGNAPESFPFVVMNPIPNLTSALADKNPGIIGEPVTFTLTGTGFVSSTSLTVATGPVIIPISGGTASLNGTHFVITVLDADSAALLSGTATITISNPLPGGGNSPTSFSLQFISNPGPEAVFNPPSIFFFPGQDPGTTSAVMNVQITNSGGAALTLTATPTITGTNPGDFALAVPTSSPACNFSGGSVAVGASCFFGMTFSPPLGAAPGLAFATLNVTNNDDDSPQHVPISGSVNGPIAAVFPTPVAFGSVPVGTTSAVINVGISNFGSGSTALMVTKVSILASANSADFAVVGPANPANNPPCSPLAGPFSLTSTLPGSFCAVGLTFAPSLAQLETATLEVTFANGTTAKIDVPLSGTGVKPTITSISPSVVAIGGPAFTLTVTGTNFVSGSTVNFNASARLTTFVNATQLLASLPASDISASGSFSITVTNPSGGGTSEPKTLVVAEASTGTNDDFNNATNASPTPFRTTENTTLMTVNTGGRVDPTPACAPVGAASSGKAKSAWFKFVATANGRVVSDTRFSSYDTILSVYTGAPGSFTSIACAHDNVPGTPTESLVSFAVTSGTTYFLMVTDVNGVGGTLTFSLDFASAAPANDDNATSAVIASAPFSGSVNSILATPNTNAHADPTPPCAAGLAGLVSNGQANSVWYEFTPTSGGTVTADTLSSPYETILNVTSGTPVGAQVACNASGAAGIAQSQVSFAATSGTHYFFMVSSVLGDGGATNFHLSQTVTVGGAASITATAGTPQSVPVNTLFGTNLQVTVKDNLGNLLGGVQVTFTAPSSGASGSFAGATNTVTATTNSSGVATAAAFTANSVVGAYAVNATVSGTSLSAAFSLTNLAGPAATLTVTGYPNPVTAGTANNFTVTAVDTFNNTAGGYRGTVHFTSSDAQAVLPANYTFTAADSGVHTFSATLKTAGTQSLTATDTVTSAITGSQTGITVPATTAATLTVSGYSNPATAGAANNFTVKAVDAFNNTATGYLGTVHFSSSDAQAVLPANYTFTAGDSGVHTFSATLKTAGTQSLTATDTVTSTIKGSQTGIAVTATTAATLTVAGYPNPVTAGTANNFTVTAVDAFNNTAGGYRGTVHFTSSDAQAVLPANYTFTAADSGVHTFSATLKTAGTQSLTATDTVTSTITGSQTGIVVTAPTANLSSASLAFGNQRINTTSTPAMNVSVTNSGGAPLSVASIALTGTDLSQYILTASANGAVPACALTNGTVAPGGSCNVAVQFKPTSTGTHNNASVTFTDNANGTPGTQQNVALTGTGIAPVASLPASLMFGNRPINQTASLPLVLTNTGMDTLNLAATNAVTITQTGTIFGIGAGSCANGQAIPAQGSCTINVTFTPTAVQNYGPVTLTVTDDSGAVVGSTQTSQISGAGVTSAAIFSPNPLTFTPSQRVNTQSAPLSATLTNSGTLALNISSIGAITGTNASDFASATATAPVCAVGTPVAANASCNLAFTFKPTGTQGRTAQVVFTDDAGGISGSTQTLTLNGTGIAPTATVSTTPASSPLAIAFANQIVLTTSATSGDVNIKNTGTDTLNVASLALGGASPSQYKLVAPGDAVSPCSLTAGFALTAGSSCNFGVQFAPTATGSQPASVVITDDSGTITGSTQSVALTGAGVNAPTANLSSPSLAFGNQRINTTSTPAMNVSVTNSGGAQLSIASIALTGTDSNQYILTAAANGAVRACVLAADTLAPGGSCNVAVQFKPTSTGTHNNASVTFTDNANANGTPGTHQNVALTGTGTSPVAVVATSLPFGNQTVNQTATLPLTVTNNGTDNLNLASTNAVVISGTDASFFGIGAGTTCTANLAINPSNSCTINVTFAPTAVRSYGPATLTITDDSGAVVGSTQPVSLTGAGVTSTVNFAPSTVQFGNQRVNTTSTTPMTSVLTNSGSTLSITSVALDTTTGNSGDFLLVPTATGVTDCRTVVTVAAGASCTIAATFTPTATGARTATVKVTDSATGSPHTFTLTGTGIAPIATPSPTTVTFTNQIISTTSAAQTVTLTNSGTDVLHLATVAIDPASPNASDFAIPSGGSNACVAGMTISPTAGSNTCIVSITFTPGAAGARGPAVLKFTDDSNGVAGSIQTANLSGTGVTPPTATPSPTSLTFSNQPTTTTSAAQNITLQNTGGAPLSITSITITGTNLSEFALASPATTCPTGSTGGQVAPASSCVLSVTFSPTGTGTRTASINIAVTGIANPAPISLTGTGTAPDLAIAKSHSGNFEVGVNGIYTIKLTNNGTAATQQQITVTDTLPAGLTFVSGTGTGWTCNASGQLVTCTNPGPINMGAANASTITLTVMPTLTAFANSPLVNTASVADLGDSGTGTADKQATDQPTVITAPDVAVSMTHAAGTDFVVNSNGTYTIKVTNNGTGPTKGPVNVSASFPTGLKYFSSNSSGWTCSVDPQKPQSANCVYSGAALAPAGVGTSTLILNVSVAPNAITVTTPAATGFMARSDATVSDSNDSSPTGTDKTAIDTVNLDNAVPTLASFSPALGLIAGATTDQTITLTGTGLNTSTVVNFGAFAITGGSLTPNTPPGTSLTVTIPHIDLASAGNATVTTTNPVNPTTSNGGGTNLAAQNQTFPVVALATLAPSSGTPNPAPIVAGTPYMLQMNLSLSPSGATLPGDVTISCSFPAAEAGAKCTPNPATILHGSASASSLSSAITITAIPTNATSSSPAPSGPGPSSPYLLWFVAGIMMSMAALLWVTRQRTAQFRRAPAYLALVLLTLGAGALVGCTTGPAAAPTPTPTGPSTITVTATAADGASVSATVPITVSN